ncbi:MAG: hypothetical protein RLY93_06720 [Sumerlaeia bacterium]
MNVLVCALESPGMLFPALKAGRKLTELGHNVRVVTGPDGEAAAARAGLEVLSRPKDAPEGFRVSGWGKRHNVDAQMLHLGAAWRQFPADAVIGGQLTLGPYFLAERERVPLVVLGMAAYLWPTPASERATPADPAAWREREMRRHYVREALRVYEKARTHLGLPAWDKRLGNPLLANAFLVRSCHAIEGPPGELPPKVRCAGALLFEPEERTLSQDVEAWLDRQHRAGRTVALSQVGRSFGHPSLWCTLRSLTCQGDLAIVADVGRADDPAAQREAGDLVLPVVGEPLGPLAARAGAIIGSGHSTLALLALAHRVPTVTIPHGSGADLVARQLEKAGLTQVVPPEDGDVDGVRMALERAAGPGSGKARKEAAEALRQEERRFDWEEAFR